MKNDRALREHVVALLTSDSAHLTFDSVVKGLPAEARAKRPTGAQHSAWELLEHLRITQKDLLDSCRNPKHVSPDFPAGYWPKAAQPAATKAWDESVKAFQTDLHELVRLVEDENVDLLAPVVEGRTVLRQALLSADHTSYHLGQLLQLRRLLGAWEG